MKILIVDDEAPARSRLRSLVEELEIGEVVAEAANGQAAVELAETYAVADLEADQNSALKQLVAELQAQVSEDPAE